MTADSQRVAEWIRAAFRGVTLGGGVGLRQGQGLDDYADFRTLADYREKDEKTDWSRIPISELNDCFSSLSFFDAEGLRFHLPAYIIADLEGTLDADIMSTLTGAASDRMRFAILDESQRRAVREFLLIRLEQRREDECHDPGLEEAIHGYWADLHPS
jgi:hypothetical protein